MGVTIGFTGRLARPSDFDELQEFVREFAKDREWGIREQEKILPHAELKNAAGGVARSLEAVPWKGALLLPHFLCEWLPILALQGDGTLTDSVPEPRNGSVALAPEVLVKTQFAGTEAHKEICAFLDELRRRFVPDLKVDDEGGYFGTGNAAALEAAFRAVDQELRKLYMAWIREPSAAFEIGGARFRARPASGRAEEFGGASPEMREYLLEQDQGFIANFGGFGFSFDHSMASLEDLELIATEADKGDLTLDDREYFEGPFIHGAGAYFGRTLVSAYGGSWVEDEDEGWVIRDVAGIGLEVNPFLIVEDRVHWGPVQAFPRHAEWITRLKTMLVLD